MARIHFEITHPDRVLFPADGITKGDLVDYYSGVADVMLPHLKGRPLTVQRFPCGIGEKGFIQQDFADSMPDWMGAAEVAKQDGTVVHPVAERREALVWLANQNCITLHAWQSRQGRLDRPDRLVFDLDPSEGTEFSVVVTIAKALLEELTELKLTSFVKTSGATGIHIYIPVEPAYTLSLIHI